MILTVVLAMLGLMTSPLLVQAADTGTVTCTVSGQLVSVSVSDGSVSYGTLALSGTKNTALYNDLTNQSGMQTADTQTASNNGSVAEDFNIKSSDAVGTQSWTLGSPDVNSFRHEFLPNGGSWTTLTTVYQTLASNVAVSGTKTFDLRITMPSSTSDYSSHTITVTVQAVAH